VRKYTIVILNQLNIKKIKPINITLKKIIKKTKGKKTMQENTVAIVARVRRRGDRPPLRKMVSTWQIWREKEFLSLISKI
jgi:hypothetical protein